MGLAPIYDHQVTNSMTRLRREVAEAGFLWVCLKTILVARHKWSVFCKVYVIPLQKNRTVDLCWDMLDMLDMFHQHLPQILSTFVHYIPGSPRSLHIVAMRCCQVNLNGSWAYSWKNPTWQGGCAQESSQHQNRQIQVTLWYYIHIYIWCILYYIYMMYIILYTYIYMMYIILYIWCILYYIYIWCIS